MAGLRLCKDGVINFLDDAGEVYEVEPSKILSLLNVPVLELVPGFSLRDYFKMFLDYPILQELDPNVSDFLDEYRRCPSIGCVDRDAGFKYISIGWCIEMMDEEVTVTRDVTSGKKGHADVPHKDCSQCYDLIVMGDDGSGKLTRFAMDFIPLRSILDLPIKIAPTRVIHFRRDKSGPSSEERTYPAERMNFYDFVDQIIGELAFHGTPEERDDRYGDVVEEMKAIKEKLVDGDEEILNVDENTKDNNHNETHTNGESST